MSKGEILDCSWKEFEEMIQKSVGSDFIWKIRSRNTEINRQAVMVTAFNRNIHTE